jgi:hypothetical protein
MRVTSSCNPRFLKIQEVSVGSDIKVILTDSQEAETGWVMVPGLLGGKVSKKDPKNGRQ